MVGKSLIRYSAYVLALAKIFYAILLRETILKSAVMVKSTKARSLVLGSFYTNGARGEKYAHPSVIPQRNYFCLPILERDKNISGNPGSFNKL